MDVSHLLDGLNDAQRQAVAAPLGAALVLAGAGSGKTRVLVHRVAWLIQVEGVSPHSILAVTFTNKAAAEMRRRIEGLLGHPGGSLWIGTFHGLAHRLLRLHWREAGLPQSFQILDAEDQARLLRKVLKALELDETRWVPREILWFINAQKDEGLRAKHLKDDGDPTRRQLIQIYHAYEEACQRGGVVDFAELLLRAYEIWKENPSLLEHYRTRFRHVLVDEFQDTNAIQYKWLTLLAGPTGLPFVVGDDDQCLAAGTQVTMGNGAKRGIESIVARRFRAVELRRQRSASGACHRVLCEAAPGSARVPAPTIRRRNQEYARARALCRLRVGRNTPDLLPVSHVQRRGRLPAGHVAGVHQGPSEAHGGIQATRPARACRRALDHPHPLTARTMRVSTRC